MYQLKNNEQTRIVPQNQLLNNIKTKENQKYRGQCITSSKVITT